MTNNYQKHVVQCAFVNCQVCVHSSMHQQSAICTSDRTFWDWGKYKWKCGRSMHRAGCASINKGFV